MINKDGHMVVYLPTVNYGGEEGHGVLSVHDTYEGAIKALEAHGYRWTSTFTGDGAIYAYQNKTANECPYGFIEDMEVRP